MNELLATARRLVEVDDAAITESDLRRAVSTCYYALFVELATLCADELAGSSVEDRGTPEWRRVYRALEHGRIDVVMNEIDPERKSKAKRGRRSLTDPLIEVFAEALERLKGLRHTADYDPSPLNLTQPEVLSLIADAEAAVLLLSVAPPSAKRQLAFACIVARRKT